MILDLALSPTRRREHAAVKKARALGGPALVRRLRYGAYTVPSATDPRVGYVVTGTGPNLDGYRCTCTAGQHGHVCWHAAATHLARLQHNARREWRRLRQRRMAAVVPAADVGIAA